MSEEWCREQLAKLQIKDQRLSALTEIHDQLSKLPADELAVTSNFLSGPEIFNFVENLPEKSNNTETKLACEILSICMANLEINQSDNKGHLDRYLQHPNADVKLVGLNELHETIKQRKIPMASIIDPNIIISMIRCLESPSTSVSGLSVQILIETLEKYLDDTGVRTNLERTLEHSTVTKCRVYEVVIKLAIRSIEIMEKVDFILQQLINDLNTDDLLLELNVLNLLSELALSSHGLVYLENKEIFDKITRNIEDLQDNPMKSLLVPGYMKFFGSVSCVQPSKIIQGLPNMVTALCDCILDQDCSILPVAFDTLGHLARSADGKILLHSLHKNKLRETLGEMGKSIHNLPTQLQTRTLNCLEVMFTYTGHPNNQVTSIIKTWFDWLTGTNGCAFIMDFCQNPFPEIKVAALKLLRAICTETWGQEALEETAGFVEFLLDRRTEYDKDAIHEKFNVISVLANSHVFNRSIQTQLQKYVADGAFYITGDMEVAIDGS